MARKNSQSLIGSGRAVADKAVDTWNDLASTVEDAVESAAGRGHSAAHDAQDSLKSARKDAKRSVEKARKNAQKSVQNARGSVKVTRREAARRANAARDALAGRKPKRRWPALIGIVGVAIGAAIGAMGARKVAQDDDLDSIESKLHDTASVPPVAETQSGPLSDKTDPVGANPIPTSSPVVPTQMAAPITVSSSPNAVTQPSAVMQPVKPAASTKPTESQAAKPDNVNGSKQI